MKKVMEREKRKKLWMAFALLLAALAFLSTGTASADTIYVPDNYAKIQWTVDNASADGTIIVGDGIYTENVNKSSNNTITSYTEDSNILFNSVVSAYPEGWSDDIRVTNDSTDSVTPSADIGPDGSIHIVWADSGHIYYKRISANGSILVEKKDVYSFYGRHPIVKVDSNNYAHIVIWCMGPAKWCVIYRKIDDKGEIVCGAGITNDDVYEWPSIAVDPTDNLPVLIWNSWGTFVIPPRTYYYNRVMYVKLDASGKILTQRALVNEVTPGPKWDYEKPSVSVDNNGLVNAVWKDKWGGDEFHLAYYDGTTTKKITTSGKIDYPRIVTDSNNKAHIVYKDYSHGNDEIYYSDGTTTKRLTNDAASSQFPRIAAGPGNILYVVWSDNRDGNNEIYFLKSENGGSTWEDDLRLTNDSASSWYPGIGSEPSQSNLYVVWTDDRDGNGEIYYKKKIVPVLLVHGWGSSADAWDTSMFIDEGFVVETFEYKTRQNITTSAKELAETIHGTDGKEGLLKKYDTDKIDIVAHSEGGLVSRYYIERGVYRNDVRKLIMIGTPNHGLDIKRYGFVLAGPFGFLIAEVINGPAGRQMATHTQFLFELNGNDNCADLHPDKDITTTLVDYYTLILQSSRPTISHKHFKILFISGKITFWVKDGDFVVAEESLKLTGATHKRFDGGGWLSHCEETKSQVIIDQVISWLRDDPPKMEKEEYATSDTEQIPDVAAQWSPPIQGTIYLGEVKNHIVLIDNATTKAYFNLFWQGSDLDLVLYTPSGVKINSSVASGDPNINYTEGTTFEFYDIQNPEPGNWTKEITAIDVPSSGENYSVITFMKTGLFIGIGTDKNLYVPNEPITVVAYVQDNGTPLLDANVTAKIYRPDQINSTIQLYDDGTHDDGGVNDGIYANTYTDTAVSGLYDVAAAAQATINDELFIREAFTTLWVEQYPDLTLNASDITFSSDAPLADENITINTTVHNIGEANATNATILFYDGEPMSGERIGEDIINVSVNATANASVSWIAKAGVHEIYVLISPYNVFLEEDYTNNMANKSITVNTLPVASFTYTPLNPVVNQTIAFNASTSYDPDGNITNYEWDFGDGTNRTGEIVTPSYTSAGTYNVTLTVTDNDGATNTSAERITVSSMPDLVITEIRVCWPENCTICYNVTNIGDGTAPAWHNTTLYVDGDAVAHDPVSVNLSADASYTGCFGDYNWTYTPLGNNITVYADNNNTIEESNETNNCLTNIWKCGDVNCDEAVDMSDVIDLLYYVGYPGHYTICNEWAADVNCDTQIDMPDVRALLNYVGHPGQYELKCCCIEISG